MCAGFQTLFQDPAPHRQLQLVAGDKKKKGGVNECKLQIVLKLFCNAEATSASASASAVKNASKKLKAFAAGNGKGVKETNEPPTRSRDALWASRKSMLLADTTEIVTS